MTLRLYVDFNTMHEDPRTRVYINLSVNEEVAEYLEPGLIVTLFDDQSLEVEAMLEFDDDYNEWFGLPDWSTAQNLQ